MATNELSFSGPTRRGDSGRAVREVQEWLTLHKLGVTVDGVFGPATEAAVKSYQSSVNLEPTGVVDQATHESLVAPLANALRAIANPRSLSADILAYAEQHLAQRPREVGGPNAGPWVRTYMNGNEGPQWPWCAGFACFILRQAAAQAMLPLTPSFSCDELGRDAMKRGTFLTGGPSFKTAQLTPGAFFLVRRPLGQRGWHHTGIVIAVDQDSVTTIEGNTNEAGGREGFEVSRRIRATDQLDFIVTTNI